VGVGVLDGRLFLHQMAQNGNQNGVFEHIGMVAGVKSVAVTEHAGNIPP
jgi:hypothetical protein